MKATSVLILIAGAFVLAACPEFFGGPRRGLTPTPEPQANLNGQIVFGVSGGGQQCTGNGAYRLEPINITGSAGRRTAIEPRSVQWSGLSEQLTGGELVSYGCVVRFSEPGLAVGTWRITAASGGWTAECQRQLGPGLFGSQNQAQFYVGTAGCG